MKHLCRHILKKLAAAYQNIRDILKAERFAVSDYTNIAYGIQFSVSIDDWSGVIRIYQSKKGTIRNDYSQLKNGEYASKVIEIIEKNQTAAKESKGIASIFPIIGTDESGKGDYFGPLVSAGVYVDEESSLALIATGVKDSKCLSDSKNIELAQKVAKICRGRFSVIEISPEKYNDLYEQLKREKKNLNTLLAWGHAKAIEELLYRVDCGTVIADQFADERFILSKLQGRGKKIRLIQMHRAEQHIAVASASILARARFLEKLSKLSNQYRIELPKGASQAVVVIAKKVIELYGEETLRKVAKLHFKTTKEVLTA